MNPEVLLEPINPIELPPEELEAVILSMRAAIDGVDFAIGYEEEEGSGVTWVQAIHMFLPSADFVKGAAYSAICTHVFSFFKKRRQQKHQDTRTCNLVVHDGDGRVIEILSLKPGDETVTVLPPDDDDITRPKPTKRWQSDMDGDESSKASDPD